MRRLSIQLAFAGLITMTAFALPNAAHAFTDSFDSYPTGTTLIGQGGWMGWDNNPAYNATVVSGGLSAPNRVHVTGAADLVRAASLTTSTRVLNTVRTKVLVPSTSIGDTYFILLNRYQHGGPYSWSVQLRMNAAQSVIQENRTGSGPSLPLVTDQWKEIRCEIDTSSNVVSVYYDGQHLVTQPWTMPGDPNAESRLAAVDLYSDNPNSVAYYDDLRVDPGGPTLVFGHFHTRLGSATLDVVSQPEGLKLLVDNLLHPGDGFQVDFEDETNGMDLDWDPIPDSELPTGAQVELEAIGSLDGSPSRFGIGKVLVRKGAMKELEYVNSYTGESFTIEAYLENHRVGASHAGPGGRIAEVASWPRWVTFRDESVLLPFHRRSIFVDNEGEAHDIGDVWLGLGSRDIDGDGAQAVQLPNGTVVLANLIRVIPNNAAAKPKPKSKEIKKVYGGWNQKKSWPVRLARRDFGVVIETGDNVTTLKKKKDPPPSSAIKCCTGKHIANARINVRFGSGPGEGFEFNLDPPVGVVEPDASITTESYAMHDGTHRRVKRETTRRNGSEWDLYVDFADIGVGGVRVIGLYNEAVVLDYLEANGLVATTDRPVISTSRIQRSISQGPPITVRRPGLPPMTIHRVICIPAVGPELDNLDEVLLEIEGMELCNFDVGSRQYGQGKWGLELDGCTDPTGQPFTVIFRDPLTGEVLYTDHIVLDGAGEAVSRLPDFRPNDQVEVLVRAPAKWLAKKMLLPANRGLHRISMQLKTGDIDSDNEVSIGDYAMLSSAFGSFPGIPTYNPNADLDFDEEIGIGDYALLSQNFGLVGDD